MKKIYTFTNGDVSVIIIEEDEEYARELLHETVIDTNSFYLESAEDSRLIGKILNLIKKEQARK